ncbi:MAG: exopolysaccharide biosynthesis GT4 family glycosyltransferase EpsE [Ornithinimicrobium sp.]
MRLGYLVPEFPSQTHAFFWREIAALREMGHEVCLFSTTRPDDDACQHRFGPAARAQTTYLAPPSLAVVLRSAFQTRPRRLWDVLRYVRSCQRDSTSATVHLIGIAVCALQLAQQARVLSIEHLHIHSCADAAHLGAIARLLGGPSFSLTLHGDLPVYGRDHRLKMSGAAFVSTVTRPLQEQVVKEVGLPVEKVPTVWMGVDTDRFRPLAGSARQQGPSRVITVARLNPNKGHRFALAAIRDLIDGGIPAEYHIVGSGDYRAEIQSLVEELGLAGVVTMTGALGEEGVRDLLLQSDIFVLPSFGLGEAAPVSVMEAMACGLPVVSTVIGGTPDMIEDGQDGMLVPQKDVAGLVESLRTLACDAPMRSRIGERARSRAVTDFDYRRGAASLAEKMTGRS